MTTTEPTPRRVFKVGDKTFPDPGPEYSVEAVLRHLRTFYPELAHATTTETTRADGTVEITFQKQVTRKGAAPLAELVAALHELPVYDDPQVPVYAALAQVRPLTLQTLHQHSALLHEQVDAVHTQVAAIQRMVKACHKLPPTPLAQQPWLF